MFRKLAARDAVIATTTCALWLLDVTSGISGMMTAGLTLFCLFTFHEWGHVLGAWHSRSIIYPPTSLWSPFLYNFDVQQNTNAQFLLTSIYGFIASGLGLALVFFVLPPSQGSLSWVKTGVLALAGLTIVFEFPIAIRAALGKPLVDLRLFPDFRSNQ